MIGHRHRYRSLSWMRARKIPGMLWTIFAILVAMWLAGWFGGYVLGGLIHLLFVAALVVLILQLIARKRPEP